MNSGVPTMRPAAVFCPARSESRSLASPKSSTLTKFSAFFRRMRKMFSGFRSRWMMPARCAASSASQVWTKMGIATDAGTASVRR